MPERTEINKLLQGLGMRIKELRQAKGMSQEELADLAGCHRTYVGMIERGEGNPSLGVLFRIADALDTGLKDFLS